ncbi:MAG: DUF362 domain-containing protein [Candidatus Hodarchaeota archaeon]
MSLVSLIKIQKRNYKAALLDSLKLIKYNFPQDAKRIVIKPNMCYYYDYSTGYTTDPKFVGAAIEILREQISSNPEISIVESDASAMKCRYAFKMLGYEDLAKKYDVDLVNLSKEEWELETVNVGRHSFSIRVPKLIKNADLKINVTKVKYANPSIKFTCGLKNIFGCNPYFKKYVYHPRLGEVIVGMNKLMKFDLCILDADMVLGGQTRELGLVMTSEDVVAFDSVAARIAGINPNSVGYLKLAEREGLGRMKFDTKGVPWELFRAGFPRRSAKKKVNGLLYDVITRLNLGSKLGLN